MHCQENISQGDTRTDSSEEASSTSTIRHEYYAPFCSTMHQCTAFILLSIQIVLLCTAEKSMLDIQPMLFAVIQLCNFMYILVLLSYLFMEQNDTKELIQVIQGNKEYTVSIFRTIHNDSYSPLHSGKASHFWISGNTMQKEHSCCR